MNPPATTNLHRIRPARESDLDGLLELVGTLADSLTSLPASRGFLQARLQDSQRAFHPHVRTPGGENYLFVLERLGDRPAIIGCSGLIARVGGFDPFYTYSIRRERLSHPPLGIDRELEVLHLRANHKGPSELCSLLLHPQARGGGIGRLLSLSRLLFISAHRRRFSDRILAELRGHIDTAGKSPFWEAVGRTFFSRDFYEADGLSGLGEKDFIRDLMPRHPIYIDLLPEAARACIGRVHRETAPALALLLSEGLAVGDEVDIFDAGPIVSAPMTGVRTIRETIRCAVHPGDVSGGELHLVANPSLEFRCCLAPAVLLEDGSMRVACDVLAALELQEGSDAVASPARARAAQPKCESRK